MQKSGDAKLLAELTLAKLEVVSLKCFGGGDHSRVIRVRRKIRMMGFHRENRIIPKKIEYS